MEEGGGGMGVLINSTQHRSLKGLVLTLAKKREKNYIRKSTDHFILHFRSTVPVPQTNFSPMNRV